MPRDRARRPSPRGRVPPAKTITLLVLWAQAQKTSKQRTGTESPAAGGDLVEPRCRERDVGPRRVVAHEERIGDSGRILPLGRERPLPMLPRPGAVHPRYEPHEGRP